MSAQPIVIVATLESRLKTLHESIITNQYQAGRILVELRDQFAHGQWLLYLRQLCQRIGMSQRTSYGYIESYETLREAGGNPLVHAAEKLGINVNRKPVRTALFIAHQSHPHVSPTKIANFAKMELSQKHKNPAVDQLAALRKRYNAQADIEFERLGNLGMTQFQVRLGKVNARHAPRGKQTVTVELTLDQLRYVKGTFDVGATQLTYRGVKKFLAGWGIK
jgi:hypothetical protein